MKILIPAILLSVLLCSCFSLKPVEYRRADHFSFSRAGNSSGVSFSLVFYNPNSFGCRVTGIESEGMLNERLLFRASVDSSVRAGRNSDFTIPVNARLAGMDFHQLLGAGLNLLLNDEAIPMKVKGKLRVKKFIFSKTYHFDYTQRIDKAQLNKLF